MIDCGQRRPAFDARRALLGVDTDTIQPSEVDDQAAVADTQTGAVVSAAAHCEQQVAFTRIVDCRDHVGDIGAARDGGRSSVNHAVVYRPRGVVAGVAGLDQFAAERGLQLVERDRG